MFAVPRLTPLVKALIIALIACFVVVAILDVWVFAEPAGLGHDPAPGVFEWLALSPAALGIHTVWQLFTYPFVNPPVPQVVMGFLIDLLFFWLFVSPFEERFGPRGVATLCAAGTLAGGVAAIAMGLAAPTYVGFPLYGMSGWTLAALGAFATIYRQGTVSFFGVIPMRAWMFVVLAAAMATFSLITTRDLPNFAADIAALIAGFGWARWTMRTRPTKPKKKKRGGDGRPGFRVIQGGRDDEDDDDDDSGSRDRPRWLN